MKTGRMKRKMTSLMAIVTLMNAMTAPYNVLAQPVEEVRLRDKAGIILRVE